MLRTKRSVITAALALGLFALPAGAAGGRICVPAGGDTVVAGRLVEVRWDGLDPDVDELELLLSVDPDGADRIRLTSELDPGLGHYLWEVPDLPSETATLRLRFGLGGDEIEGEPSGRFRIVAAAGTRRPTLHFADGEWWARPALAAGAVPPVRPEHALALPPAGLGCPDLGGPESVSRLMLAEVRALPLPPGLAASGSCADVSASRSRRPVDVPQRR
jgi:hypothetical protein